VARRPGSISKRPMLGTARTRVWSAMRILKQFDIPTLAATADAKKNNVARFVFTLARNGYLRVIRPRVSGVKMGSAVYGLVRDTGPIAPGFRPSFSTTKESSQVCARRWTCSLSAPAVNL